jgi:hypothetical protein
MRHLSTLKLPRVTQTKQPMQPFNIQLLINSFCFIIIIIFCYYLHLSFPPFQSASVITTVRSTVKVKHGMTAVLTSARAMTPHKDVTVVTTSMTRSFWT